MPVLSHEEAVEQIRTDSSFIFGFTTSAMGLESCVKNLPEQEDPEDLRLLQEMQAYTDALMRMQDEIVKGRENSGLFKLSLESLGGFKEFLEREEPGRGSNYQRLTEMLWRNSSDAAQRPDDPAPAEFQEKKFFDNFLKTLNGCLGLGLDMKKLQKDYANSAGKAVKKPKPAPAVPQNPTGAAYIEDIRRRVFPKELETMNDADFRDHTEECVQGIMDIIAARMLCNSDRGHKDKLEQNRVDPEALKDLDGQMDSDDNFLAFRRKLREDDAYRRKAVLAARKGHGGGLDDMFKDFLKQLPAGQMSNSKICERYLPTVRERLEALKEKAIALSNAEKACQASLDPDGNETERTAEARSSLRQLQTKQGGREDIAAEMVLLRNLAHAEKGKKSSLDVKIPTVDPDQEPDLRDQRRELCGEALFTDAIRKDDGLWSLAARGHGGDMTEAVRSRLNADVLLSDDASQILNKNTVGRRLEELRKQARRLGETAQQKVDSGDKEVQEKFVADCQKLLGEYFLLDSVTRDPKTHQIDTDKLSQEPPWSKIQKLHKNGPENSATFRKLVGNAMPYDMMYLIQGMGGKTQAEFMGGLAAELKEPEPEPERPARNAAQQPSLDAIRKETDEIGCIGIE